MLGHHGGGHGEEHAVFIDKADLLALADEGHGLALDDGDADLVGEQAHDGGALDPGDGFKLLAPLGERDKEDVAADVFAEDGEHIRAADLGKAGGLNVAGPGDAETGVAT